MFINVGNKHINKKIYLISDKIKMYQTGVFIKLINLNLKSIIYILIIDKLENFYSDIIYDKLKVDT